MRREQLLPAAEADEREFKAEGILVSLTIFGSPHDVATLNAASSLAQLIKADGHAEMSAVYAGADYIEVKAAYRSARDVRWAVAQAVKQ